VRVRRRCVHVDTVQRRSSVALHRIPRWRQNTSRLLPEHHLHHHILHDSTTAIRDNNKLSRGDRNPTLCCSSRTMECDADLNPAGRGLHRRVADARTAKKQRMSWSPHGAHRVAVVCAARLGGRWTRTRLAYWWPPGVFRSSRDYVQLADSETSSANARNAVLV
jgi:hypothetical protein